MNRTAHRAVVAAVLVAVGLAGCSGGGDTEGLGLEEKSPAEVLQAAVAALQSADSVHVTGTGVVTGSGDAGPPTTIDVRIQGDSTSGTLSTEAGSLQFITVGDAGYINGDQGALAQFGVAPEIQAPGAGRWIRLTEGSSITGLALDDMMAALTALVGSLEPEVEQDTLNDQDAVVVTDTSGTRLYVANTGVAYPLRGEFRDADLAEVDFSDYGDEIEIAAPPDAVTMADLIAAAAPAVTGPLTGEELAWLQAIMLQRNKIDNGVTGSGAELTEAVMRSLEDTLRSCTREQTAPPSARLQPVYALVQQGCAEYDKGAACFATAADIGIPFADSAESRAQEEALDCGFAALGPGSAGLAEAEMKGFEIQEEASQ